jgi:phosphatidylserine decarboxylase
MGRLLLGSTVVMLFPKNVLIFVADWAPSRPVRLGEPMATALP